MARRTHQRGKRPHGTGTETFCRINGEWRSTWWPAGTPDAVMDSWLEAQHRDRAPRAGQKTFARMVPDYLNAVSAMPSYRDRKRDMKLWTALYAERSPHSITKADVQSALQRWEKAGAAPSTIRHRRTALSSFYATMLPDSPNPARSAKAPRSEAGEPRGLPMALFEAIIDKMKDIGRGAKGQKRPDGSQSKARMRVFVWTGIPPKQMIKIEPRHLDLVNGTVWTQPRRKGRGVPGRTTPLLPPAVEAFKEWVRLDCWGEYSTSSVRTSFRRACKALEAELREQGQVIDLSHVRPYDARHTFCAYLVENTGNLPGTQHLMSHASPQQTMVYAEAGVNPAARAVVAAITAKLDGTVGQSEKPARP